LKAKPNKTPSDKKAIRKQQNAVNRAEEAMRKSEPHNVKPPGTGGGGAG